MTKLKKNIFLATNFFISIIGCIYLVFNSFLMQKTSFGIRPHPQTSTLLHLHIITAPFLLIVFGSLWSEHIYPKLRANQKNRKHSGISILTLFIIMTATGYFLQTSLDLELSTVIGKAHIITSIVWFFLSLWHCRFKFSSVTS